MKPIEQRAKEYAEEAFGKALKAPWPKTKQAFEDAYTTGATEALSGLWQTPETLEKVEGDPFFTKILTIYRTFHRGSWLTVTSINSVNEWLGDKVEYHKRDELIAWMPIPPLKSEE